MQVIEVEREKSLGLHVLCHEHHVKLQIASLGQGAQGALTVNYACGKPNCPVHYNSSQGYFSRGKNGDAILANFQADVRCTNDGMPMYLTEVLPEKRSFRLWRCPACNTVAALNP